MDYDMEISPVAGPLVVPHTHNYEDIERIVPFGSDVDLCALLTAMSLERSKDPQARLSAFARHDQAEGAPPHGSSTTVPSGANARMPPSADDPAEAYLSDSASEASARSSSSSACASSSRPIPQPTSPPAQAAAAEAAASLPSSSIIAGRPAGPAPCPFLQSILASLAPAPAYPAVEPYHAHPPAEAGTPGRGLTTTNGAYLETLLTHRALLGAFPPMHAGCSDALREIARALEVRAWRAWDGEWRPDWDGDGEAVAAFRQEAFLVDTWVAESRG